MKQYDKVKMSKKVHRVRMNASGDLVTTCGKYIDKNYHKVVTNNVDCKVCLKDWNIETDDKYK